MKKISSIFSFLCLALHTSASFANATFNIVLIPDNFNCHHVGIEYVTHENSTFGIIGSNNCSSDRPTYGASNSKVKNKFSRVFVPWRYSMQGALKDGYFIQTMVGLENSEFTSESGSSADVSFIDLTLHGGYQWFWENGFNVSTLAGVAVLTKQSLTKNIDPDESVDVSEFIDKNTKSNAHIGIGVAFGWAF